MLKNRLATALGLIMVAGMIVAACTPAGGTQVVVQTQIVEQETVVTATPEAGAKVLRINIGTYPDILDHCCEAWNRLVDQPWTIMSIGLRDWAHRF